MDLRERLRNVSERLPLRVLAPLALVLLLLWGFVELADEVVEGTTRAVDVWVLRRLRTDDLSDPIGPQWLEGLARDVTAMGGNVVLGLVVTLTAGYLALVRRGRMALFVVMSICLGFLAVYLLKLGFDRPRPDVIPHHQEIYTSSFPSGHSMGSALTFLTLAALLARVERRKVVQAYLLCTALFLSALVGVSRVYLGVHYPTDVIGGWAMGTAWAVLAWLTADALSRAGRLGDGGGTGR